MANNYQYLDSNGLTTLWGIIKNRFGQIDGIFLGGSGATAGISNKMATIQTFNPNNLTVPGLVPVPGTPSSEVFLRGDGNWAAPVGSTYAAGSGLSLSGTTFNHTNSITSGSVGDESIQSPVFGGSFKAISISVDAQGHITDFDQHNVYIPDSVATTTTDGLMSSTDKIKLNSVASSAEVNQNAFSNIKVGSSTVAADSKTDTLTLVGSGSISLSASTSTDTITITGTDTTYAVATSDSDGLMSAADKQTLDNIVTTGGEPNQDAFSYIIVSGSTVAADDKKDKLTLVGSGSVSLSATTGTDTITITGVNTTYAASTSSPLMDGTAAVGTSTSYARGDHRHPTDTSRAPLASPQFTGTPGAPTATAGTASTQIATTAFVNTAITNALANITGIEYEVVSSLPASGEAGVIYLISNSGSSPNIYDEYIWTGTDFEKIGTTDVDLTGYVQDADLVAITTAEIEAICV